MEGDVTDHRAMLLYDPCFGFVRWREEAAQVVGEVAGVPVRTVNI